MKKTLLFTALLGTTFIASTKAQTFTNASFETWHDYNVGSGTPNPLSAPTGGWSGVDSLIKGVQPFAAIAGFTIEPKKQLFQSSTAHSGSSSASVRSEFIGDQAGNVPGVLVNARISINLLAAAADPDNIVDYITYTGGTAINAQVDTVKAWILLDSLASMDEGVIVATTLKTYQNASQQDSVVTIGAGTVVVPRGTNVFREFSVPLVYTNEVVPEKLVVAFMSSNFAADSIHVGSSMLVDDVSFSYKPGSGVGIRQPLFSESKILVYPNPSKNQIYFNLDATVKPSDFSLAIYDINGRAISKEQLQHAVNSKNVSHWAKGSYFYTLVNDKLNTKEQGKFVVE